MNDDRRRSRPAKARSTPERRRSPPRTPGATGRNGSAAPAAAGSSEASRQIDERVRELGGWRAEVLDRLRRLVLASSPRIVETVKWRGTPVWCCDGIVCTGEAYAATVKLTFARGASLPDPQRLFNASLDGNTRRAIDIREGESVDARAFQALVRAAVAANGAPKPRGKRGAAGDRRTAPAKAKNVRLLSGGNPQIAKADGNAPVQAYIDAMPGWKRALGQRLDTLVERTVPGVTKAVKWNSPFYGVEGQGWFLAMHCFTHYVKLAFFRGGALAPPPPGVSKDPNTRYVDLREGDAFDTAQLTSWIEQAAALPGWIPGKR